MSLRPAGSTLYLMNHYWIRPTTVPRSVFLDGHAECRKCHAQVRPSVAERAFVRMATASTATARCAACSTTTDFDLEPRDAADGITTTGR